ncbi:MAG: gluconate 2-dehydrogenase subunit 3 family protein [Luteitalea sp.]|nr:gluconate 2-dehydrogenase subunit 3 family protein [Acidobacteriota bacterium]
MKRRDFLHSLAAAPAVTLPALAQQPAPSAPQAPAPTPSNPATPIPPPQNTEPPKFDPAVADDVAAMVPRFFTAEQFAALAAVSALLMPAGAATPGAREAHVPEFLDFLVGRSPADRQDTYRSGLDALNAQATARFKAPFGKLDTAQQESLLAPLREPWTFDAPADPLARFLRAAKLDVRTATLNSRDRHFRRGHFARSWRGSALARGGRAAVRRLPSECRPWRAHGSAGCRDLHAVPPDDGHRSSGRAATGRTRQGRRSDPLGTRLPDSGLRRLQSPCTHERRLDVR